MATFPHNYRASAQGGNDGDITLSAFGVNRIPSQPPKEFGGPGNRWSPESLLVATVADCFCLSFRMIANASRIQYEQLQVNVEGTLDQVDGKILFTNMDIHANLCVSEGISIERAERLLQKAEEACLITNSLSAATQLHTQIEVS